MYCVRTVNAAATMLSVSWTVECEFASYQCEYLTLLLNGCDDYDEVCNGNIIHFVHHFM